jgi:hypothetical protein
VPGFEAQFERRIDTYFGLLCYDLSHTFAVWRLLASFSLSIRRSAASTTLFLPQVLSRHSLSQEGSEHDVCGREAMNLQGATLQEQEQYNSIEITYAPLPAPPTETCHNPFPSQPRYYPTLNHEHCAVEYAALSLIQSYC